MCKYTTLFMCAAAVQCLRGTLATHGKQNRTHESSTMNLHQRPQSVHCNTCLGRKSGEVDRSIKVFQLMPLEQFLLFALLCCTLLLLMRPLLLLLLERKLLLPLEDRLLFLLPKDTPAGPV